MNRITKVLPSLNVGCGGMDAKAPNQINADLYPGSNVDVVFDAVKDHWPLKDDSIGMIYCNHVLEHLPDPIPFFREAWRVVVNSSFYNMVLRLPFGPSNAGFGDMMHVRYYTPGSFCGVQPGYDDDVWNPQYRGWKTPWEVQNIYVRVNPRLRWLLKWPIHHWGLRLTDFLWGGYIELIIALRALKTQQAVDEFRHDRKANSVPIAYGMYQHEWEGRALHPGELSKFRFFGEGTQGLQHMADRG